MPDSREHISSAIAPVDDRELAHPHRTDQGMIRTLPAAISEPESGAFGLTVIEGPAGTGAEADVAFDHDEGVGVGLVKTIHSERLVRRLPELEPEMVDPAVLERTHGQTPVSDEDESDETDEGFGFVLIDDRDQDGAPANEGEEEQKGGAVFEAG